MKRGFSIVVAGLVTGFAQLVTAAAADGLPEKPTFADSGISMLRVSGALALVVAIFLGGIWIFKNWQRLLWRTKGAPKLNVIEVRPLGGRHALYLVGYDQQRLLLAASPSGVQFITHLPDVDLPAAPLTPSFARVLDQAATVPETQGAKIKDFP